MPSTPPRRVPRWHVLILAILGIVAGLRLLTGCGHETRYVTRAVLEFGATNDPEITPQGRATNGHTAQILP